MRIAQPSFSHGFRLSGSSRRIYRDACAHLVLFVQTSVPIRQLRVGRLWPEASIYRCFHVSYRSLSGAFGFLGGLLYDFHILIMSEWLDFVNT